MGVLKNCGLNDANADVLKGHFEGQKVKNYHLNLIIIFIVIGIKAI